MSKKNIFKKFFSIAKNKFSSNQNNPDNNTLQNFKNTNTSINTSINTNTNANVNINAAVKPKINSKVKAKPDFEIVPKIGIEFVDFNAELRCNLPEDINYQILSVELDRQDIGLTYNNITKRIEGVPTESCNFNVNMTYKLSKWKVLQEQKSCKISCEIRKNTHIPRLKFRVNNVKQFEVVEGLKIVHFDKAADHYSIESVNFLDENINNFVYDKTENVINGFPTQIAQCSLEVKYFYKNLFPGKKLTNNVDFFVLENKQALKLNLFITNANNATKIKQFEDFTAIIQSSNTNLHSKNWEITSIKNFIELHKKGIDINLKNKTISGNTLFAGTFFLDIEYDVIVGKKIYSFAEHVQFKVFSNEEKLQANISSLGSAKQSDFYYNKINIIPKIPNNIYLTPRIVNVSINNKNFYYNNATQEIIGFVNNATNDVNVIIEYDYPLLSKLPNISDEYVNSKVFTNQQTIKVDANPAKPKLEFANKFAYYNVPFSENLELSNKFLFAVVDDYYIIDIKFNTENIGLSYNRLSKKIEGKPTLPTDRNNNTKKDDKILNNKDNKNDNNNNDNANDKTTTPEPNPADKNLKEDVIATIIYTYHKDKLNNCKWNEIIKLYSDIKIHISKDTTQIKQDNTSKYWKENSANEFIKGKEKSIIAARQCINTIHQKDNHCENDFYIKYHNEHDCYITVLADGSNAAKFSYFASKLVVNIAGEIIYNNLAKNLPNIEAIFNMYYNNDAANNEDNTNDKFDIKNKTDFEKNIKRSLYNLIGIAVFTAYKKLEQEYNTNKNVIGDIKNLSTTLLISVIKKIGAKWLCVSYSVGDGIIVIYDNKSEKTPTYNLLLGKINTPAPGNTFLSKKEISTYDEIINRINVKVVDDFTAVIMMNNGISAPKFQVETNLKKVETWTNFWNDLNKQIPSLINKSGQKSSNELTAKDLMKWINFADAKNQNDRVFAMIYQQ